MLLIGGRVVTPIFAVGSHIALFLFLSSRRDVLSRVGATVVVGKFRIFVLLF